MNTLAGTLAASILDKPASNIERPKPVPQGHFTFVVQGMPREDKSAQKKTDFWEYTLKAIHAHEDVDSEALTAWYTRADGSTKTIGDIIQKPKFYLTEGAAFMLKDFIEACGVDESEYESLRQGGQMLTNRQVVGLISHRASDNGNIFAEVRSFSKIEE